MRDSLVIDKSWGIASPSSQVSGSGHSKLTFYMGLEQQHVLTLSEERMGLEGCVPGGEREISQRLDHWYLRYT